MRLFTTTMHALLVLLIGYSAGFSQSISITTDNSKTYNRYDLQIEHFPFAYPDEVLDSYIIATSGRQVQFSIDTSPPRLAASPYPDSDLRIFENGTDANRDTLIIWYSHPDTSFTINYLFQLSGSVSNDCRDNQDFFYEYINNPPVFLDQLFRVNEGASDGEIIGRIIATDENPNVDLIYALVGSSPSDLLTVDNQTGDIKVLPGVTLDYEAASEIRLDLRISDGVNITDGTVTVEVDNINEAPEGPASLSIDTDENQPQNSDLLTIDVVDPENDPISFSITQIDVEGIVLLDASTGILTLIDSAYFDHETNTSLSLTTSASDGEFELITDITLNIVNVNEVPTGPENVSATLEENTSSGTVIADISGEDPDGDNLSYSITTSSAEGAFTIEDGNLVVGSPSAYNFEERTSIEATLEATDGEYTYETSISIIIEDVNEAPSMDAITLMVDDTAPVGTVLGSVSATDPESDAINFNIVSDPSNYLSLNSSTGEITLANTIIVTESETYTFRISASDGSLTTTVTHTLEINYIPPPLSVEGLEGLETYPNPVHDFLYLEIGHLPSDTRIYLHSMDGKLVAQPKFSEVIANSRISMEDYQPGTYILTIKSPEETTAIKIQKI